MNVVTRLLVKKQTDDGQMEVEDHIEIGRQYRVDLDDARIATYFNTFTKRSHSKLEVFDVNEKAYFPAELLGIKINEVRMMEHVK